MVMGPEPDTLILGRVYQRIDEYNDALGFETWQFVKRSYVRSDTSGKGYLFLLDSMQEYLTADVNALAGDTVYNVLTATSWGFGQDYWLNRVIVDSVVVFTNNDVSVTRRFVSRPEWGLSYPTSAQIFWQTGMGNGYGPVLIESVASSFQLLLCLREQDTYVYSSQFGVPYLPGIPCDCPLEAPLGVEDLSHTGRPIVVSPNPSSGFFELSSPAIRTIEVRDMQGRVITVSQGSRIDLSVHPPGVYAAVFTTSAGRQAVRLVVER
jgi:hypothetical protein